MGCKYILWDFDNTLAYRDGMWSRTIYDLLQEYGVKDITYDSIRPYLSEGFPWHTPDISHDEFFKGVSWWNYMNAHFGQIICALGVEKALSAEIASRIREAYIDISKWHLYEDTIPCLEKTLKIGWCNIILSNHVPELNTIVEGLKLKKYFCAIYNSADLGWEKPNPMIFRKVAESINNADNIVMIGDNYEADVKGALDAGINAILVRKSNDYNYDRYCSSLEGVFEFLG